MRFFDFLPEWIIRQRIDNILLLVSEHVQDQARDRGIPWTYVERILNHLHLINPEKLSQMLNFNQFYIRDNDTWAELGCKVKSNDDVIILYVNTVVRREPNIPRNKSIPTLQIN